MGSTPSADDPSASAFLSGERRRRSRNLALLGAVAVAAAATIGALLFFASGKKGGDAAQTDAGSAATAEKEPIDIELPRTILAKEPCDEDASLDLADGYNQHERYAETIAWVDEHEKRCGGELRVILWKKFYAQQQLKQWQPSVDVATILIEGKPEDTDYWWWRGESLVELGRFAEAAADFRQSIANSELGRSTGVHVRHLADIAKQIQRPCEGAFALGVFREARGDLSESAATLHAELSVLGDCGRLAGRGAAKIAAKEGQPVYRSTAKVGGQSGTFLVDGRSAYVTVTRAFAQRAGLATTPPAVTIWTAYELHRAELAVAPRVELGRASAPEIDVAVVDALPPGIDGVIGQSFLWRFSMFDDGMELALKER